MQLNKSIVHIGTLNPSLY